MGTSVPKFITWLPRSAVMRKLATATAKRFIRRHGHRIPWEFKLGAEWMLISGRTGNFDYNGEPSFRASTTSVWFSERITDFSLAIDGKQYKNAILIAGDESYRRDQISKLPFIPGRTYSFLAPGLTLPDGIHFIDLRIKTDLQDLDYAGLPIILENGTGGLPPAMGPLQDIEGGEPFTAHYVPHIHYDVEWIFDRAKFLEVGARNLLEAAAILDNDPEHTFVLDQVPQLEPFYRQFPDMEEKFGRWAREGRVEAVNGLYAEPDVNLAGGESLVRGSIMWQKFAERHFGAPSKVGWFIDCFGQSAQIPQILAKSGSPYFAFNRTVMDKNMPSEFWWEGMDGSRVLTHWMKGMYNIAYPVMEDPEISDGKIKRNLAIIAPNRTSKEVLYPAGVDHGRPLGFATDRIAEWNDKHPKFPIRKSTPTRFFESLETSNLKTVRGEFQRELWGVYSSRIKGKMQNRRCEIKVLHSETWANAASIFGDEYPSALIEEQWKEILADQFHDCICGCSADSVADGMAKRLAVVENVLDDIGMKAQRAIAKRIDTSKAPENSIPIAVFNPLSWSRNEWIEARIYFSPSVRDFELLDDAGRPIQTQVVDRHYYYDGSTLELILGWVAPLPSLGWRTFYLKPLSTKQEFGKNPENLCGASGSGVFSDLLAVQIDSKNGLVKMIDDKSSRLAFNLDKGNRLILQRDLGTLYNPLVIPGGLKTGSSRVDIGVVESGPLRAAVEVKGRISKNDYTQRISLTAGSPRVDFTTSADMNTPHRRLRVAFKPDYKGKWRHGVPYGVIERQRHELPARDWADLSDERKGMTLIQFGMPGMSLEGGMMTISLWRSTDLIHFIPAGPGALSLGKHEFRYALHPHGPFGDARPRRRAREHHEPPRAVVPEGAHGLSPAKVNHAGKSKTLPASFSLAQIDSDNLTVEAFYREGDNIVIRMLECCGLKGQADLSLGFDVKSAALTDFMGKVETKMDITDNKINIPYGPYSILTLTARL